jgi:hypothetical protein
MDLSTMSRRLLVLLVAATLTLASAPASGSSTARADDSALPEPVVGARFVRAYAEADPEAIAALASPLYRTELGRRGIPNVPAFLPVPWDDPASAPPIPWLKFTYVDGIVDDSGFTHLLYVARSLVVDESSAPLTVWRVDLDPRGRLVWGDVVFDFGPAPGFSARRTTDVRLESLPEIPVPSRLEPIWSELRPRVLLSVTSTGGDTYYALGLRHADLRGPNDRRPSVLIFFAADTKGHVFPGVWSFGEPTYQETYHEGYGVAPEPVVPVSVLMNDEDDALWRLYWMNLW